MLLKKIRLENIRSYLSQEIIFPEGTTVLSGDIGSGKTTILLAVEFALFGPSKRLGGEAILRNGKNNGSVELCFIAEGKEVIIKRVLKRAKEDVKQESGYIVIDGIKKSATPVELKADIINLLGYPPELASKAKNLVYRYTVYTPQEEMKHILTEDDEERLDTLRKIFGIDRYKRIRQNAELYGRSLREKRKELEGKTYDIDFKKELMKKKQEEAENAAKKAEILIPDILKKKSEIKLKKDECDKLEKEINELGKIKKEIEFIFREILSKENLKKQYAQQSELSFKQVEILKKEVEGKQFEDSLKLSAEKQELEGKIKQMQEEFRKLSITTGELNAQKKIANDIKERIAKIDKCIMCEQSVSHEHKASISERENFKIISLDSELKTALEKNESIINQIKEIQFKIAEINLKEVSLSAVKIKLNNISEKEKLILDLKQKMIILDKEISDYNLKKRELEIKIAESSGNELIFKEKKAELENLRIQERNLELEKAGIDKEIQMNRKQALDIGAEIAEKEMLKKKLRRIAELQNWIDSGFSELMGVMEKHVMVNIYSEFNELFKNWFELLLGDSTISAKLDDNFAPLIEQNGYETSIHNLSGGEKTAAALAYRLALNRVINDMMNHVKTKDLLILDEPTDGFSSEQLDKVRDVLNEIGVKQLIIVSHESKIESFAENIIRVTKNEHISEAVQ